MTNYIRMVRDSALWTQLESLQETAIALLNGTIADLLYDVHFP